MYISVVVVKFFVIVTIQSIAHLLIFSSVVKVLTIARLDRIWSPIVILSWFVRIVSKVVSFFMVWPMMIVVSLILFVAIISVLLVIRTADR